MKSAVKRKFWMDVNLLICITEFFIYTYLMLRTDEDQVSYPQVILLSSNESLMRPRNTRRSKRLHKKLKFDSYFFFKLLK